MDDRELRALRSMNKKLTAILEKCADHLEHEIWNSGEDEAGNSTLKEYVRDVKAARALIEKSKGKT
jgi:hypothetical protein